MNSDETPYRVSAIVSTHNAERFIGGCIEDLEAQTIADHTEIIVVDSASEQKEAAIVRSYQQRYNNIRYFRTAVRQTVYGAWNHGVQMARGRYITNANTDDRHRNDAFEKMAAVLDTRADVVLVYADAVKTRTENQVFDRCTPSGRFNWSDWDRSHLLQKGCFIGPQPMWRRKVHAVFGLFNQNLVSSGDYEFWLRISQLFEFHHLKLPLGLYLENAGSVEHVNADLKSTEDLQIQADYLQAAIKKRLLHCRLLQRLGQLLESGRPSGADRLAACLAELEMFICPDVDERRASARAETENYLELKYRILSGKVSAAQVDAVVDALARLMLVSMRWYRLFWEQLIASSQAGDVREDRAERAAPAPIKEDGRPRKEEGSTVRGPKRSRVSGSGFKRSGAQGAKG